MKEAPKKSLLEVGVGVLLFTETDILFIGWIFVYAVDSLICPLILPEQIKRQLER